MSATMKAIEISAPGPAETLRLAERPVPVPGPGDVLVRVRAAGVNRPDILQRMGKYPPPPGASDIPGLEVAGDVIESHSPHWREGDKVCALVSGGGYAEYAVAPGGQCLPVPANLDYIQAAALPETAFTVWNNLVVRAGMKAGDRVLVHGGASGIGTMAIQMAVAMGAHVATTAGSAEKCAACAELGAELAVNYRETDFRDAVAATWGPDSVDIVLDMIGGDYVPRNLALLAPDGRHVSIATQLGSTAQVDLRQVMQKRVVLTGSTLRSRPVAEKTALADGLLKTVWPHIEAGRIKPVLFKTFPLDRAAEAHGALEQGDHIGKIVLTLA